MLDNCRQSDMTSSVGGNCRSRCLHCEQNFIECENSGEHLRVLEFTIDTVFKLQFKII